MANGNKNVYEEVLVLKKVVNDFILGIDALMFIGLEHKIPSKKDKIEVDITRVDPKLGTTNFELKADNKKSLAVSEFIKALIQLVEQILSLQKFYPLDDYKMSLKKYLGISLLKNKYIMQTPNKINLNRKAVKLIDKYNIDEIFNKMKDHESYPRIKKFGEAEIKKSLLKIDIIQDCMSRDDWIEKNDTAIINSLAKNIGDFYLAEEIHDNLIANMHQKCSKMASISREDIKWRIEKKNVIKKLESIDSSKNWKSILSKFLISGNEIDKNDCKLIEKCYKEIFGGAT